jgi:hypothetical protein
MPFPTLTNVSKFCGERAAVPDINLAVHKGEFVLRPGSRGGRDLAYKESNTTCGPGIVFPRDAL